MVSLSRPYADKKGAYNFYIQSINVEIEKLKAENKRLDAVKQGIWLIINNYKDEIDIKSSLKLNNPNEFIGEPYTKLVLDCRINEFTTSDAVLNKKVLIQFIRQIVKNNKKINANNARIKNKEAYMIPNRLYNKIIDVLFFNASEIINSGITFSFKFRLGKIRGIRREAVIKQTLDGDFTYKINFGATKKKKQELLNSGYSEGDLWSADKFNKVIDDYLSQGYKLVDAKFKAKKDPRCGVPYIVYCDEPFNYWIEYVRNKKRGIKGCAAYKFKPSQDYLRRFQKYAKALTNAALIYPLRDPTKHTKSNNNFNI